MGHSAKYDEDFYAWTMEQAARLRDAGASRTNLPLDWENLAEEIESMGRSDRRGIESRLARIIEHLLKLELSPSENPRRGWKRSVNQQRQALRGLLQESPSLKAKLDELFAAAWGWGRQSGAYGLEEDGILDDQLPAECPYTADQVLDSGWWPANEHGLD